MAEQDQVQPSYRPQHLSGSPADAIPDSLLALAKDGRYLKEFQSLFLEVLNECWTESARRRHQLLEQESWMLATVLCLALGMKHTARKTTLGMEAVGIQFSKNASRWKLIMCTFAALGWAYTFSPHRSSLSTTSSDIDNSPGLAAGNMDERLRGSSRREFHERQLQAMLRRAREAASNHSTVRNGSNDPIEIRNVESSGGNFIRDAQQRTKKILFIFARVLASAILTPFEGPHTLAGEIQQQQLQNTVAGLDSAEQAGRWLAKAQLAHFCITGLYPTWLHRFSGHSLVPTEATSSRIHFKPAAARLVGLMLSAQVVAQVIHASSSGVSRWLVHQQQNRESCQSSRPEFSPPIVFKSRPEHDTETGSGSQGNSICSICKMERKHPAAPACGHVFCWKCLVHWVSVKRAECPLCRASCRPQDIVALYNYRP